jgi:hypothetical protein
LLVAYINFAHPEAWETIVEYFGSTPFFRESPKSRGTHGSIEEPTWLTSITIPHFILGSPSGTDREEGGDDFPPEFDPGTPRVATNARITLQEACMSICMTGDPFGEFWTSSLIGTINSCQQDNSSDEGLSQLVVDEKMKNVLERYKYDKHSNRNLGFALQLPRACHSVSRRYEDILDKFREIIDLEVVALFSTIIHGLTCMLYRKLGDFFV